jgi:uncharacterized protein YkwD
MHRGIILFCSIALIVTASVKANETQAPAAQAAKQYIREVNGTVINLNEIIDELNIARANPKQYAEYIKQALPNYKEDGTYYESETNSSYHSKEGPAAALEAIEFLNNLSPAPPVKYMNALALSSADHLNDLGPKGMDGHYSSYGASPLDRIA